MTEEMDAMEIIGRSFRVPDEGIIDAKKCI